MEKNKKQVVSANCNIFGSHEKFIASKLFLKGMVSLFSKRRVDSWTVPPGPVPAETLPVHIMKLVGIFYRDVEFSDQSRKISLLQWSDKWCGRFYDMDVDTHLAHDDSV